MNSNASLYSKLWSFGVRSLRSRECGLYEASDLLLDDLKNHSKAIVAHMRTIAHMLLVDSYHSNITTDTETYITSTRMDQQWMTVVSCCDDN